MSEDLLDPKNQTRQDAYTRVVRGKLGSLAHKPTEVYLQSLRQDLYAWIGEVEKALFDLWARQYEKEIQGDDNENHSDCG